MEYVGLTIAEAISKLKQAGIQNVVIKNNFVKPLENSTLLVTSCKIEKDAAVITVGSFNLNL